MSNPNPAAQGIGLDTRFGAARGNQRVNKQNIGWMVKASMNAMAHYTVDEVKAVLKEPDLKVARAIAAKIVLRILDNKRNGQDFDRLMDRTLGKPKQQNQVSVNGTIKHQHSNEQTEAAIRRCREYLADRSEDIRTGTPN